MLSNISFQIPIGIAFLTLIIWRLLEEKKNNKEKKSLQNKSDTKHKKVQKKFLIIGILIAIVLGCAFYNYQPLKSLENKNGFNYLSSYTYDSFIVFDGNIKYENSSCLVSFISVFPISLIVGVWYIFKEESEHLYFFIPNVMVSILELILIVSNKTISFIPNYVMVVGFNLLQIYMIIYLFARVKEKMFSLTKSAYIALFGLLILMFIPVPSTMSKLFLNLSYMLFVVEAYIVLNYSDKRFWRLASWSFTIICLFDFIGYGIVNFL